MPRDYARVFQCGYHGAEWKVTPAETGQHDSVPGVKVAWYGPPHRESFVSVGVSAHGAKLARIKDLPSGEIPQGAGELAHERHNDPLLVTPTMGLYLVLVPRLDDLIALNQAQGREIEIAPSRPRASLGELDLALVRVITISCV